MLLLNIPDKEYYNEETNEFVTVKGRTLQLEHSLVSISKWEAKYKKPFLESIKKLTRNEFLYYVKCMTITQNVQDNVYRNITNKEVQIITEYINDPMTATTFGPEGKHPKGREHLTSELVYYYMTALNIPFECQKWHFNRLMTLIKVCSIKNTPPKKMNKSALRSRNRALNEARKAKLHTHG